MATHQSSSSSIDDTNKMNVSTQTFIIRFAEECESLDLSIVYESSRLDDDIVLIKYMDKYKKEENDKAIDVAMPKTTTIKKKKKNFLNCVTLYIRTKTKNINVKLFHNSVLQLTGCTNTDQVKHGVKIINDRILMPYADVSPSRRRRFFIIPSMRNVDFDTGYCIDRLKLAQCLATYDNFSVPPMTSGYMGLKIKIPVNDEDILNIPVLYSSTSTSSSEISDDEILRMRDLKETYLSRSKIFVKNRFVSISVFQNGKVLISSIDETVQNIYYAKFKSILDLNRDAIEYRSNVSDRVFTFGDI